MMDELVSFMEQSKPPAIMRKTITSLCELSGSTEGRELIVATEVCANRLLHLVNDQDKEVRNTALQVLVNISSDESLAERIFSLQGITLCLLQLSRVAVDAEDHVLADLSCKILSNMTRTPLGCREVVKTFKEAGVRMDKLIEGIVDDRPFRNYLAPVMCNLTQLDGFRCQILNRDVTYMQQLLSVSSFPHSTVRRKGIIGAIRNCCFDTSCHEWLLTDPNLDTLTKLALPLAGPEEFEDDITDKLPIGLQYLEEDKQRETDAEIRKMLIECIHQLCATQFGRSTIKDQQIYVILRELHKWEPADDVIVAIENLVDILIGDEPGSEFSNLKEVEVPADLQEKFRKMDQDIDNKNG